MVRNQQSWTFSLCRTVAIRKWNRRGETILASFIQLSQKLELIQLNQLIQFQYPHGGTHTRWNRRNHRVEPARSNFFTVWNTHCRTDSFSSYIELNSWNSFIVGRTYLFSSWCRHHQVEPARSSILIVWNMHCGTQWDHNHVVCTSVTKVRAYSVELAYKIEL